MLTPKIQLSGHPDDTFHVLNKRKKSGEHRGGRLSRQKRVDFENS